MRRALGLLSLLTLAAAPLVGQQALVGIYPAGVQLDSGQRATVPVVVDMRAAVGSLLGSYQLTLSWDPAIVRYVSTAAGGFGAPTVNEGNAAAGSINLAGASPGGGGGLFSVAQVTFEMLVDTGSSPVSVSALELTAAVSFATIPVVATPGDICTSAGTYGDINRDGSILSNDALLVVTAAVGLPIAPYVLINADVDNDGDADTRDALIILTAAVGLPTTGFRVGQPNGASCAGAPATALSLTPGLATLAIGDAFPIAVQVFDQFGTVTSARGLVWSTDAAGVATVDSTGRVTAVGNGDAAISAMAIGISSQSVSVKVEARHTWYVDASVAARSPAHIGSALYPFPDIQPALDAAAAGDSVRVVFAPGGYGAANITKAVTVVGDSGSYGMPQLRNSTGAAIVSNASGTVSLKWLALEQSNAGLDARGDTLLLESIAAASLRGPAFRIHGMRYASLTGVSANSSVLAGISADSSGLVRVNGAAIRVVAARNDSAVGLRIVAGDSASVTGLSVVGVDGGAAAVFGRLKRASLDGFDVRQANGVHADSIRVFTLANGHVVGGAGPAMVVLADTLVMDSVLVDDVERGVQLAPMSRDTVTQPNTAASVTRSAIRNVRFGSALVIDRFARLSISRGLIRNVPEVNGLEISRIPVVQIDSTSVTGVPAGIAISVDRADQLALRGGQARGGRGGLSVDDVRTVSLVGLEVDSSAVPPARFCFACTAGWGVRVAHADSVRLDSLNVHDNVGGGILVDSARVVVGRGSIVDRNQGFGGSGGCEVECLEQTSLRPSLSHPQYSSNHVPGIVLNLVEQTRIASWTLHDNANGGLLLAQSSRLVGLLATVDTSSFRGTETLLQVLGNDTSQVGEVAVRGGAFRNTGRAIYANYLRRLSVVGAVFDSAFTSGTGAVEGWGLREVLLQDNTMTGGASYGFQISYAGFVDARGNVIRNRAVYYSGYQESALELANVDSAVVYGNRLELNGIRGIIVRGSGTGLVTIDNNVVADDSSFALQLHRPATVTRNLFARNANAIWVDVGGEASQIHQNNFEGNVFDAIRNESNDIVNATGNYWNAADGPQCGGVVTGCISSTGDIVYGATFGVTFSPFESDRTVTGAPLFVPAVRTSIRVNR